LHGGLYTPVVRPTSFSRYISVTEAYHKFGLLRINPQFSVRTDSEGVIHHLSVGETLRGFYDFHEQRLFQLYNFRDLRF
jgi:hypothetical protein